MQFFCDASSADWRQICDLLAHMAHASKTRSFFLMVKVPSPLMLEAVRLVRHLDIEDYVCIIDIEQADPNIANLIELTSYQQVGSLFRDESFRGPIQQQYQDVQCPLI